MNITSDGRKSVDPVNALKNNRLMWEFKCQSCFGQFIAEVPKGPSRERAMLCVGCGSRDIQRVNIAKLADTFCGG